MIPVDADFFQNTRLLWHRCFYMVKDGMKEALENFVKNGGILITTFMSGIVGQSDNVYLGGYPGRPRDLGVWVEEIDALAPEQKNKAKVCRRQYSSMRSFVRSDAFRGCESTCLL